MSLFSKYCISSAAMPIFSSVFPILSSLLLLHLVFSLLEAWEYICAQDCNEFCISHMAVLSVITRVMNGRNQKSQAFATRSCPFL